MAAVRTLQYVDLEHGSQPSSLVIGQTEALARQLFSEDAAFFLQVVNDRLRS